MSSSSASQSVPHAGPESIHVDSVMNQRSMQKRQEIGLGPPRPTAKSEIQRPPETNPTPGHLWSAMLVFILLMIATAILVMTRLLDASSDELLDTNIEHQDVKSNDLPELSAFLILEDDFVRPHTPLAVDERPEQWIMGFLPGERVYRIRPWPGYAAWSVLSIVGTSPYRLETSITINVGDKDAPFGYAGFLARYQDDQSFYIFEIDGQERFQLLLQKEGIWQTIQPWTFSTFLNGVDTANHVVLEDNGQTLKFSANGQLLITVNQPQLPAGTTGLAGGTQYSVPAEVNFDWLKIYELRPINQ